MIIIAPETVTDAVLTASNVPEPDTANGDPSGEWSSGTGYLVGNRVFVATVEPDIHRVYECLIANTNQTPWTNPVDGADNPYWLDVGATNRWAMFDTSVQSVTVRDDEIDVTVTFPGTINGVAFLNVSGATVQVTMTDSVEGEVYDRTSNLTSDSGVQDWYAYYFTPIERTNSAAFLDLPAYTGAEVRVRITDTGNSVTCGACLLGVQTRLGEADYGTSTGIRDYSTKEQDAFGNFVIVPRPFSRRADYAVTTETSRVTFVQNFLASIRTTPAVYIGDPDRGATIVYGYYRRFDIVLSNPTISDCNLSVEGLT